MTDEQIPTVALVTFENDSVLNQKSLSLPIGKVSIRQTVILFVGILMTFLVFLTTDHLIMSGVVFAAFLGIGLIGTRVMTADQLVKSHLLMLIRGTSLEKKLDYMLEQKKKNKLLAKNQQGSNNGKGTTSGLLNSKQIDNSGIIGKALSQLESLYKKKKIDDNSNGISNGENNNVTQLEKRYSATIELTDQNILNVSSKKLKKKSVTSSSSLSSLMHMRKNDSNNNDENKNESETNDNNGNEIVDDFLNSLSKKTTPKQIKNPEEIQNHVTILLDGKRLDESETIFKSKESLSVVLEENKQYSINVFADKDESDVYYNSSENNNKERQDVINNNDAKDNTKNVNPSEG